MAIMGRVAKESFFSPLSLGMKFADISRYIEMMEDWGKEQCGAEG
jgi:hypothetical protein